MPAVPEPFTLADDPNMICYCFNAANTCIRAKCSSAYRKCLRLITKNSREGSILSVIPSAYGFEWFGPDKTGSVRFSIPEDTHVTLADLTKLSMELKTDMINFNVGYSGEQGYSEYTPGCPGHSGYIEVIFPDV